MIEKLFMDPVSIAQKKKKQKHKNLKYVIALTKRIISFISINYYLYLFKTINIILSGIDKKPTHKMCTHLCTYTVRLAVKH